MSRLDIKRPVRTGVPPRVTSLTSTTPRLVVTSIRRPARVASISKVCVPWPVSTTASTRSPFIVQCYRDMLGEAMTDRFASRGFVGRARDAGDRAGRVPPGQYLTEGFPVLSAGPTPQVPLDSWEFGITGLVREPVRWSWQEFTSLPSRDWTVDIS